MKIGVLKYEDKFECITNITDKAIREQVESMMGGYSIYRHLGYPNMTYIGPNKSFEWFVSILRMYGFEVTIYTHL